MKLKLRDYHTTYCISNISNNDGKPDWCIVMKSNKKGVIIIKIENQIGCFDFDTFYYNHDYSVLNYKQFSSSSEAYEKLMKWIGKMVKKTPYGRYFNNYNPYEFKPLDTNVYNEELIDYIIKEINTEDLL